MIQAFSLFRFKLACVQLRWCCMYGIVKRLTRFKLVAIIASLWRFHKGHKQAKFKSQRSCSMPMFESQPVETKQSGQCETISQE